MADLHNFHQIEADLKSIPKDKWKEIAPVVATRAALRLLPDLLVVDLKAHEDLLLSTLRASLTATIRAGPVDSELQNVSLVASRSIPKQIRSATDALQSLPSKNSGNFTTKIGEFTFSTTTSFISSTSNFFPAVNAANASAWACQSMDSFFDAKNAVLASLADSPEKDFYLNAYKNDFFDSNRNSQAVFKRSLWKTFEDISPNQVAKDLQKASNELLGFFATNPKWNWWSKWYAALYAGAPVDWHFATQVALIGDEVWDAGADAVADAIRGLAAQHIVESHPQAEEIILNDDNLFAVVSTAIQPQEMVDRLFAQIDFALDLAVHANDCDMDSLCEAYKYLEFARTQMRDDANTVEQHFEIAADIIENKITQGAYTPDPKLMSLVKSLRRAALQLRSDHPAVSQAWLTRAEQRFKELDTDTRQKIAIEFLEGADQSTGNLKTGFVLDAENLQADTGANAQAKALQRSGNRAAKMTLIERFKAAEGSGQMAAAKIAMRFEKAMEFLSGLL